MKKTFEPLQHAISPIQPPEEIRFAPQAWEEIMHAERALERCKKEYVSLPNAHINSRPKIRYKLSPKEDAHVTKELSANRAMRASRVAMYMRELIDSPHYQGTPTLQQLRQMHGLLAQDFATIRIRGDFRDHWIAVEHDDHTNFLYSPPGKELIKSLQLWREWRYFAVGHLLVLAALSLYQWFLIHPFSDGNGRIGRMIVQGDMVWTKTLPGMCLDLDAWTRQRMSTYLRSLEKTDVENNFTPLIMMFCQMLIETSTDSVRRAKKAKQIFEEELLPRLTGTLEKKIMWGAMGSPIFDVPWCVTLCEQSEHDIQKAIDQLLLRGLLQHIPTETPEKSEKSEKIFYGVRSLLNVWDQSHLLDADNKEIWDELDLELQVR